MKTYSVTYRNEFTAKVEAEDINEAIASFETAKITCIGELHRDFFEVREEKTGHIVKETGF